MVPGVGSLELLNRSFPILGVWWVRIEQTMSSAGACLAFGHDIKVFIVVDNNCFI